MYFGAASVFYVKVLQARTRRNARIAQEKAATVIRLIQEGMGGLREHRLRGSEDDLVEHLPGRPTPIRPERSASPPSPAS